MAMKEYDPVTMQPFSAPKSGTLDELIARLESVAGGTGWTPTRIEVPMVWLKDALAALRIARGDK